jgi:hypothetical protein
MSIPFRYWVGNVYNFAPKRKSRRRGELGKLLTGRLLWELRYRARRLLGRGGEEKGPQSRTITGSMTSRRLPYGAEFFFEAYRDLERAAALRAARSRGLAAMEYADRKGWARTSRRRLGRDKADGHAEREWRFEQWKAEHGGA